MAKLQRTFLQGKMNKDLDERLIPNGQYRDAQNIQVSTSEGSDVGAVENMLGNTLQNLRSTGPDVFWDRTPGPFGLTNPVCIGVVKDPQNEKIYWFLSAADSSTDAIVEYDQVTKIIAPIIVDVNGVLNFNKLNLITGVNILGGMLFWTDDLSEPKKIEIARFKAGTTDFATQTQVFSEDFIESDVTVIKLSPKQAIQITSEASLVSTTSNRGTGITPIFISENLGQTAPLTGSMPIGSTFTIVGGFSGFLAPGSVFLNKQVVLNTKVIQEDGSYLYYEAICTITALTAGEQPNQFDGGTFRIDSISADVPDNYLNWSIVLLESDPIFQNNFPRFSYRYKYVDNEYSTYAPFSEGVYVPGQFDYNSSIGFNKGMINNLRKIILTFPSAAYALPTDDVTAIEILYKGSDSNNIYVIDTHETSSGALTTFEITSDLLGPVVESIQLLRPFDAVPRKAKSQEVIGNRIVYGNYLQNYTLDQGLSITSGQVNASFVNSEEFLGKDSIKSNRTYQLGITFIDKYNRESPVFTNKEAAVIIEPSASNKKNNLTASTTISTVPSWADYYKYYIKDPAAEYYNLVLDRWYDAEDGNVWLSFVSDDVNKIREDKYILLKKQHGTSLPVNRANRYKVLDVQNEAPRHIKMEQSEIAFAQCQTIALGFTTNGKFGAFTSTILASDNLPFSSSFSGTGAVQFEEVGVNKRVSQLYTIESGGAKNVTPTTPPVQNYLVTFTDAGIIPADRWLVDLSATSNNNVIVKVFDLRESDSPEFAGRFFVKVPKNSDFVENIEGPSATSLIQAGFNANVRAGSRADSVSTDMPALPSTFEDRLSFGDTNGGSVTINKPRQNETTFTLVYGPVNANPTQFAGKQNLNVFNLASSFGSKIRFVNADGHFTEVYNITNVGQQQGYTRNGLTFVYKTFTVDRSFVGELGADANFITRIEIVSDSVPDHFTTPNPAIFETEPQDLADLDIYYEATDALPIGGLANTVNLDYHNVYSFGNGVESNRVEDDFNAPQIGKGVRVSSTLQIPYAEERKSSSLIFSGIFNSTSGVNNTNQFIIAENITKDLNPTYGSIQKLHARDTDLIALLEDKCFRILANKDALFNADGSTNVTSNSNVLGQTVPFVGEYGISKNPESFASFGFRSYFVDKARGTVMRLSRDGLTDIGDKGMSYFFQNAFKTNVSPNIAGAYDSDIGSYNVVLGSEGLSFKERVDGWNTRMSYDPEFGISLNNEYYTFKDGSLWEHSNPLRSNFYGVQYESTVKPIFNDAPTSIKNFKTLSYEGTTGWTAAIETKKQVGTQGNPVASDPLYVPGITGTVSTWKEREGIYFNYIMGDGTTLTNFDAQDFSVQGIGNVLRHNAPYTVIEINGEINISLQPGDVIYSNNPNNALRVIGTVLLVNRVANFITLTAASSVTHPVTGDFMLFAKDSQVNTSGLLGYYAEVKLTNSSTFKEELFAVNSEIFISSE